MRTTTRRYAAGLALAVSTLGLAGLAPVAGATHAAGAAGTECDPTSGARVRDGSTAAEPKLYPDNEAKAYGVLKDRPRLKDGSVIIKTVFHVISDSPLVGADRTRMQDIIEQRNPTFAPPPA